MKPKGHRFEIVVETYGKRHDAERALLVAFAKRYPDDCGFRLLKKAPKKRGAK